MTKQILNRRGFLGMLGGAAAALAIDPDELLWTPKKTIFIPPVRKISLPRQMIGVCMGMPIYLDQIDESTMGPLLWRGENAYHVVELAKSVSYGDSTIFAIPGGKIELQVYGRTQMNWFNA
jgi:hypothetical protein